MGGIVEAAPTVFAAVAIGPAPLAAGFDRRRSDRVSVSIAVRISRPGTRRLEGAELMNLVELSLGGATLEAASRPELHSPRRMSISFSGISAELTVIPYHYWLHQLFYAPSRSSRILYRTRVKFRDPSVPALNLIYRILLAHFSRHAR